MFSQKAGLVTSSSEEEEDEEEVGMGLVAGQGVGLIGQALRMNAENQGLNHTALIDGDCAGEEAGGGGDEGKEGREGGEKEEKEGKRKGSRGGGGAWERMGAEEEDEEEGADEGSAGGAVELAGDSPSRFSSPSRVSSIYNKIHIRAKAEWIRDQFSKMRDATDGSEQGSFDDESALFNPTSPTEKKPKSKGLTAKKLKGIVKSPKRDKKEEKREKKEKKEREHSEAFKKYVSEESKPVVKSSDEWKAFNEMQYRIQSSVTVSQSKLTKMENEFEKDYEKLTTSEVSPWGAVPPHPSEEGPRRQEPGEVGGKDDQKPKPGWVGFEDDFSVTPNMQISNKLPHLNVSPLPSPKHPPLPPNNSRRQSGDADLLGLSGSSQAPAQAVPPAPDSGTGDLLGLSLAPVDAAAMATAPVMEVNEDMLALSRNPMQSATSSGNTSPVLNTELATVESIAAAKAAGGSVDEELTGAATSIVDEFLGIEEGQELKKPQDALEALLNKEKMKTLPESLVGLPDGVESSMNDDDPFGLGMGGQQSTSVSATGGDLFILDESEKREAAAAVAPGIEALSPMSDDFDPRAEISLEKLAVKPAADVVTQVSPVKTVARARPRPKAGGAPVAPIETTVAASANPFKVALDADTELKAAEMEAATVAITEIIGGNPFASVCEAPVTSYPPTNPFAAAAPDGLVDVGDMTAAQAVAGDNFNPFATITEGETDASHAGDPSFDPFQTIHDDDAFDAHFAAFQNDASGAGSAEAVSPARVNPFDKEPPLDAKFASFEPKTGSELPKQNSQKVTSSESSIDEPEEELEPIEPFFDGLDMSGWSLLLRQPTKKKLTQNRFWKPVYVKLAMNDKQMPVIQVFNNDKESVPVHELPLQASYNICNMGLQMFDQFGKCHTVKVQYTFYRERVGVKAERITPTLSDLTRVRDLKSLKDLVHRPKTTMLLDHAPQASELLKFGGLSHPEFKHFIRTLEDALFRIAAFREVKTMQYTKDEITCDIIDEYCAAINREGHIISHKARVRVFCLAFLTGTPTVEIGINDKKRRGKEVVGRHDIIPIKTEEWIRIEDAEIHPSVDVEEFAKSKVVKCKPLDAVQYEIMRFRVRPRINRELPLQIRPQMCVVNRHVEIRADVMIPGYYSNSKRSSQTPCEDITIRFPIPDEWKYLFRVEKRFRYGSVKSTLRKPGKIKGLERLTMLAQGMMPPSLIEVSAGQAKFENVFNAIVWRINRLPERNEGAYKTHLMTCKLDLGPHDVIPETFPQTIHVEFKMPNSTVSRAQIRSISVATPHDAPDKWVHHTAKYEYTVELEFSDKELTRAPLEDPTAERLRSPVSPVAEAGAELTEEKTEEEKDSDSDSDSDTDSD